MVLLNRNHSSDLYLWANGNVKHVSSFSTFAAQRQVGETALNDKSSRSHQILRLVLVILGFSTVQGFTMLLAGVPSLCLHVHGRDRGLEIKKMMLLFFVHNILNYIVLSFSYLNSNFYHTQHVCH